MIKKTCEEKVVESVNKELDCNKEKPVFWALVVTSKNINIKNDILKIF